MPIGAGLCPAGTSPAGYGVPDQGTSPVNAVLPDPTTGLQSTGRLIDPATGSYQFTADGRVVGTPTVRQRMLLALRTVRGSSAQPNLGIDFSKAGEQGLDFAAQVAAAVGLACAPLVQAGLVQLLQVVPQPVDNPDGAAFVAQWRDLTTGKYDATTVGP